MDALSAKLNTFLVRLGMEPETVPHEAVHHTEHLLHLLDVADEQAIVAYYGLFGTGRMALAEIAESRSMSAEDMMARIDSCIRRLAVTPEWEVIQAELPQRNAM